MGNKRFLREIDFITWQKPEMNKREGLHAAREKKHGGKQRIVLLMAAAWLASAAGVLCPMADAQVAIDAGRNVYADGSGHRERQNAVHITYAHCAVATRQWSSRTSADADGSGRLTN